MRPKSLDKYPEKYWSLLQKAQEEPVFISCSDISEARDLRNDLYNFRGKIREGVESGDCSSHYEELADSLYFRISSKEGYPGPVLIVGRAPSISDTVPDLEE